MSKKSDFNALLGRAEMIVDELISLVFILSSISSNTPEQMVVDSFSMRTLSEYQRKLKKALRKKNRDLSQIKDIITTVIAKVVVLIVNKINTTSLYRLRGNYSEGRRITAMKIGNSIKFIRMTKNLSQKDLAKKINISQNYLSLIENDKKKPSLSLLNKISMELEVPLSALIVDIDIKKNNKEQQAIIFRIRDLIVQLESLNDEIRDE